MLNTSAGVDRNSVKDKQFKYLSLAPDNSEEDSQTNVSASILYAPTPWAEETGEGAHGDHIAISLPIVVVPTNKMRSTQMFKIVAVLSLTMIITTLIILFLVPNSPAQAYMLSLLEWLKNLPTAYSALLFSILYAVALVFCLPGTPFNLAAGFLFGAWVGSVVNIIGCDLGACISFLIGRSLGREWAQQKMLTNRKYELIDRAVEKNAFLIIFLIRLSPVLPFGICNYLFGITTVTFPMYWAATTLGLMPCTVAYTYLGSLMRNLTDIYSEDGEQKEYQTSLVIAALVMTLLAIVAVTLVTKRTLNKAMDERKHEEQALADGLIVELDEMEKTAQYPV